MNFTLKCLATGLLLALSACSAKVTSTGDDFQKGLGDGRVLPESSDPLAGKIDGAAWKQAKAVARFSNGEYSVTLAGQGVELTCSNSMPMAPHVAFVVPNETGRYAYDGSAGGRLVNVIFPYTTTGGGGSDNILASKSLITVDSLAGRVMKGHVSALSPTDTNHTYEFSGSFAAEICDGPSGPATITGKGGAGFDVVYSEAVKTSGGNLEIRLMNKMPNQKCNAWSAWMMTETPIKYFVLRGPAKVAALTIAKGTLEYGSQGTSTGWSTEYFEGAAAITNFSADTVGFSVNAKDLASAGILASGQGSATLCP